MEITPFAAIMMMTIPALVTSIVTAANAKKTNAAWRARRDARAVARATAK